jgi:hypothetical protein
MSGTQLRCLLAMTLLSIIGFGPLSLTCLIGMYVVAARPLWFRRAVANLYRDVKPPLASLRRHRRGASGTRVKCFLSLLVLLVLDIAPVPVTGSIGLYVVIARPPWFYRLVEAVYRSSR